MGCSRIERVGRSALARCTVGAGLGNDGRTPLETQRELDVQQHWRRCAMLSLVAYHDRSTDAVVSAARRASPRSRAREDVIVWPGAHCALNACTVLTDSASVAVSDICTHGMRMLSRTYSELVFAWWRGISTVQHAQADAGWRAADKDRISRLWLLTMTLRIPAGRNRRPLLSCLYRHPCCVSCRTHISNPNPCPYRV